MKKRIYILFAFISGLFVISCDDYTDITPKGKNLLETVDELEYLLNYNFTTSNAFYLQNLYILDNDMYEPFENQVSIVSGDKDMGYILTTYDESIDRAELTKTDPAYQQLYGIISARLNVLLDLIDKAEGDPNKANQLKAESLVLRAYLHFILVNIYAKAYNPETADTDGGIAYMNKTDYENNPVKNTVAEVYGKMLRDIDEALSLDILPDIPTNYLRVGKGFAYGAKARILISMRDYQGALEAAETALTYNNHLEDHRPFIQTGLAVRDAVTSADNLFCASNSLSLPTFYIASWEIYNNYFQEGNIFKYYTDAYSYTVGEDNYSEIYGTSEGVPGTRAFIDYDYQQNASGLTTSDLYFVKAECLIRTNNIQEGMDILNYVSERRIHPDFYTQLIAVTEAQAMEHLKRLSRLEFLFTWRNFANLKRWNTEDTYKETITRTINGITYSLYPESPLWIFPFPKSVTDYNPNMTQNY